MLGTDLLFSGKCLLQTVATLLQKGKVLQSGETCKQGSFVLLQSGAETIIKWGWPGIRNWDNFIKKWVKYYKVRELLQSRPVQN